MRNVLPSLTPALLLVSKAVVQAQGINAASILPGAQASPLAAAPIVAQVQGQAQGQDQIQSQTQGGQTVNAAEILVAGTIPGVGRPEDFQFNDPAGNIANALAGGDTPSAAQLLNGQVSENSVGVLGNPLAGPAPGQADAQAAGGGAQIIQIIPTIINAANGQKLATVLLKPVGELNAAGAASPLKTPPPQALQGQTGQTQPGQIPQGQPANQSAVNATQTTSVPVKGNRASSSLPKLKATGYTGGKIGGGLSNGPGNLDPGAAPTPAIGGAVAQANGSPIIVLAVGNGNAAASSKPKKPAGDSNGPGNLAPGAAPTPAIGGAVAQANGGPIIVLAVGNGNAAASSKPNELARSSGRPSKPATSSESPKQSANPAVAADGSGSGSGSSRSGAGASFEPVAAAAAAAPGPTVTVIAGSGSGTANTQNGTSAQRVESNGGCNCKCACPAGSFPMNAAQAPAFMPGASSMLPSPRSTMQTIASANAAPQPNGQAAAFSLASSSPTPSSPMGAANVQALSQVAPTPTVMGSMPQERVPFNINTVPLQSRVTVNLGRRVAKPTKGAKL